MSNRPSQRKNRGAALIAAIGLLVVFAMLGTAYIGFMTLEFNDSKVVLHDVRARALAEGGAYAAIGELQAATARGEAPKSEYSFPLTAYRPEATGTGAYPQTVRVTILDESGRANLNFAPEGLLRALGLPESATKALQERRAKGVPLASVESLRAEGLVDAPTYRGLRPDLMTVYTGADPAQPRGYLNLNSAPETVLAAIFAIGADEAKALAGKRPFASWDDVLQKVGREPSGFNVAPANFATREMPAELALASRCFRVRSVVAMEMPGGGGRTVYAGVETVVVLAENGAYAIRYWREIHPGAVKDLMGAANTETTGN